MNITVFYTDENDEQIYCTFPAKYEVCPDCNGYGTHLNESMRNHAYSEEEFADFSEYEKEQYFERGGIYDVTCLKCKGKRVVKAIDEDSLNSEQKIAHKLYESYIQECYRYFDLCKKEKEMLY
jgi:hypothetical protein